MKLLSNSENENVPKVKTFPKSLLKGVVTAYIITFALLIIFALIITYTPLSEAFADAMVATATFISVIAGAFLSARGTSGRGWLTGIICALMYFLILWLASCISRGGVYISGDIWSLFAICILCGAIGGIIGINTGA